MVVVAHFAWLQALAARLLCGLRRRKRVSRTRLKFIIKPGRSSGSVGLPAVPLWNTCTRQGACTCDFHIPWCTAGPPRLPPGALPGLPFPGGPAAPEGVAPGAPAHQQHRACACIPRAQWHAPARPAIQVALSAEFCPKPSQGRFCELEWRRLLGAAEYS